MNLQTKMPTTADEFLRWNEGREGKREFVRGRVVEMMINVTRNHVEIAANLSAILRTRLDRKLYTVGSADFGIHTPDGVRYPDVFVDRKAGRGRPIDLAAIEPIFLAEVLSPSSIGRDFVEKMADYKGLSSLLHYLILSHEEPRVWLSSRDGQDWLAPMEIVGLDGVADLPGLGLELRLSDVYDGVGIRPVQ